MLQKSVRFAKKKIFSGLTLVLNKNRGEGGNTEHVMQHSPAVWVMRRIMIRGLDEGAGWGELAILTANQEGREKEAFRETKKKDANVVGMRRRDRCVLVHRTPMTSFSIRSRYCPSCIPSAICCVTGSSVWHSISKILRRSSRISGALIDVRAQDNKKQSALKHKEINTWSGQWFSN